MTFTVYGDPAPKGSTRAVRDRRGRTHVLPDNPRTAQWQHAVAWAAKMAGAVQLPGPVRVDVLFQMPRGATKRTQERRSPGQPCCGTPDLDKLLRAILDGLVPFCFEDDKQVAEVRAQKIYARVTPCATITVEAV